MSQPGIPAALRIAEESPEGRRLVRRHLRFGWWLTLLFLSLGMALEGLHAFKVGWYLDVANETRRFMWTLAHAHGTLFGLLNLACAFTISAVVRRPTRRHAIASNCLTAASLLMPAGFLLGGVSIYGGDPGYGILLVPMGAVLLLTAVFLLAWTVSAPSSDSETEGE